jgi:plastocyanin
MLRRPVAVVAIAVSALSVTSCGSSDEASTKAASTTTTTTIFTAPKVPDSEFIDKSGTLEVATEIVDNAFEPKYLTVSPGTKVTWTNTGRNVHNVQPSLDNTFEGIATMQRDETFSVIFDKPGDYPYFCSLHGTRKNGQNGMIRVLPAPPAASTTKPAA